MRRRDVLVWAGSVATAALLMSPAQQAQTGIPAPPPAASPATPAPRQQPAGGRGLQLPARDVVPQGEGTAVLSGRVTRLDDGRPLRRVQVSVSAANARDLPNALTDDDGRYVLEGLPAGRYTLTAQKGGFVTLQYGQRRPFEQGRPIDVANGAKLTDLHLALPRGAVVAGRVLDQDGEPVPGAAVQIFRRRFVKGRHQLIAAFSGETDDQGRFRIFGLQPATYYLGAGVMDDARPSGLMTSIGLVGTAVTFYPGVSSAEQAQPLSVELGQEVDVVLSLVPAALATIAGEVRTADGQPPRDISVSVATYTANSMSSRGVALGADGTFSLSGLPPGTYTVSARSRTGSSFANQQVSLQGSNVRVQLVMRRPDVIRGRISFEGGTPPEAPSLVRVSAALADAATLDNMSVGSPETNADWTFVTPVAPGARVIRVNAPSGWTLKSVHSGAADITDTPVQFGSGDVNGLEIVLTNRLAEVSGSIRDGRGQAVGDATVVLFADDPNKWGIETRYITRVRPDQSGRFAHRGLPPGSYLAVALDWLEDGEETNPETLARLRNAGTRFMLAEGEQKTVQLSMSQTTLP